MTEPESPRLSPLSELLSHGLGATLLAVLESHPEQGAVLVRGLAQTLRVVASLHPMVLSATVQEAFPWVSLLSRAERCAFEVSLVTQLLAVEDLESFQEVQQLVVEWRGTAAVHADPELAAELQRPLDGVEDGRSVPKP